MKIARPLTVLSAILFPTALVLFSTGCPKKETEQPAPVVTAAPVPTPTAAAVVAPEEPDAGSDAAADAADAAKPTGGGGDPTGIRKCCSALRGNMKTAPLDQQAALGIAAGVCDGLVNNPQGRQALSTLRGILKGASMPAACQ